MVATSSVESFIFCTGTTDAINEAAFVTAMDALAPDANDHVFVVEKGGHVMIGKYPV